LQVGHLNASELPEELARFRNSTGAQWGGVTEAELNLEVVQRVKALLEAEGVVVDLLPATIPPAYDADAFLSIHADGNAGTAARGWKLATPWRASKASLQLMEAVAATYGAATGMPEDVGGVTVNMRGYYAFNFRRHVYSVARTTPAIIVEMGFMTNAADRAILFNEPQRVARGIAEGVLNYLRQRDPNDGAALLPPDFPTMRARPGGAILRSAPSDEARVVAEVSGEGRVFVFLREENWYQVMVRIGEERLLGWILVEQVEEAPALTPTAVP
jgi:N-acetylmuramoyl-L-alanine amidase